MILQFNHRAAPLALPMWLARVMPAGAAGAFLRTEPCPGNLTILGEMVPSLGAHCSTDVNLQSNSRHKRKSCRAMHIICRYRQTAPSEAEETSRAYFASAP